MLSIVESQNPLYHFGASQWLFPFIITDNDFWEYKIDVFGFNQFDDLNILSIKAVLKTYETKQLDVASNLVVLFQMIGRQLLVNNVHKVYGFFKDTIIELYPYKENIEKLLVLAWTIKSRWLLMLSQEEALA